MHHLRTLAISTEYELPAGAVTRWVAPTTGQLRACSGRIWVTRQGDPRDYWVERGQPLSVAAGEILWLGSDEYRSRFGTDADPAHLEWRFEKADTGWLSTLRRWASASYAGTASGPLTARR